MPTKQPENEAQALYGGSPPRGGGWATAPEVSEANEGRAGRGADSHARSACLIDGPRMAKSAAKVAGVGLRYEDREERR